MFTSSVQPYSRRLENGLILKSLSREEDIERLAAFNDGIHGAGVGPMTRCLILDHPHTRPEHWLYIEDEASGQIVSSICFIPWTWRYEDVTLKAGEMGIVGTLETYRQRGLIRALDGRFKELLRSEGCHASHIQGIPYFYRQFGYEYSIPLQGGWRLDMYEIPDEDAGGTGSAPYTFRQVTEADIPLLKDLYDEAGRDITVWAQRDEAIWRYLLGPAMKTETAAETWLVLDPTGQPVGYWRVALHDFGPSLNINEGSRLDHPAAVASLRMFKRLALERGKPYIRIFVAEGHPLITAARAWKASDMGTYGWQIYFPDVARLLRTLAPVLERRISTSPFAGLTRQVVINLYREAFELRFEDGQLTAVEAVGYREGGDIQLPPPLIAPLVLGCRSRAELSQGYPDVGCWGQAQMLVDTLFPKVKSYLHTIY